MLRQLTLCMIAAAIMLLVSVEKAAWAAPRLDADIIKAGLRTTFIEEDGFVEEVVAMADAGELPWAMVDNAFSWAKRKPKNQFQYFRRALIDLAAREGITVPPKPQPVETTSTSPFFIQKLKDFFAALKGSTASLPFIGQK